MASTGLIRTILIGMALAFVISGPAPAIAAANGGPAPAIVSASGSSTSSTSGPELFEVGRPFPVIALPAAADGRPLSLVDFRGRKTILHVFASW